MIQSIIILMLISSTIVFSMLKHPLAMGLSLIFKTLIMCILMGSINESFWFSYILFLVFLGGMMVMFIYISSLASNEMFKLSASTFFMLIFMLVLITMLFKESIYFHLINNMEFKNLNFMMENKETMKSNYKLMNFPSNMMSISLMIYLFLTLIMSVKITNFNSGPLRNLN